MSLKLHLSVYPRARTIDSARKAIARVQKRLPKKMTIKSIERNYQDRSTFRVDCTIRLGGSSPPDALFESMEICQNISISWLLFGPEKRIDGHWQFHGYAREPMEVQGIKYAVFGISDGPIPEEITVKIKGE